MSRFNPQYAGKAARGALQTIKHLKKLPIKGLRVMDVGMNEGYVTEFLYESGAAHVVGYEPHPHAYALAQQRNATYKNVVTVNAGLRSDAGTMKLSRSKADADHDYWCNATMVPADAKPVPSRVFTDVQVLAFDAELRKYQPQAIKIDTEGSEYDLLLGKAYIPSDVQWMCVEFHHTKSIGGALFGAICQVLTQQGFGVMPVMPSWRKTPGHFSTFNNFGEVDFVRGHPTDQATLDWFMSIVERAQAKRQISRDPLLQSLFDQNYPHG